MPKSHYSRYKKDSNILLTCEHASKRIPKGFKNLGLTRKELNNAKDLYDPGSLDIMKNLQKKINASYIYSNVSRLVIDYNRRMDANNKYKDTFYSCPLKLEVLVEKNGKDELVKIPVNTFASESDFLREEVRRYEEYSKPYAEDGYKIIDKMRKEHDKNYVIMFHSFYPKYNGDIRKIDLAVLYGSSAVLGKKVSKSLRSMTDLNVGDNKPWHFKDADGSVFYKTEDMDDVELIIFEVNNKHLQTKTGVNKITNLIYKSLKEVEIV